MASKDQGYSLVGTSVSVALTSISDGAALSRAINEVLNELPTGSYTLYRQERAINEPLARLEKSDGGVLVYPLNI